MYYLVGIPINVVFFGPKIEKEFFCSKYLLVFASTDSKTCYTGELKLLAAGLSEDSVNFGKNLRSYNNSLGFASFSANFYKILLLYMCNNCTCRTPQYYI